LDNVVVREHEPMAATKGRQDFGAGEGRRDPVLRCRKDNLGI